MTLVELLVVVVIVGMLAALLLPAVHWARESARRTQCADHLRQLGQAANMYSMAKKEYPPGMKQLYNPNWGAVRQRGIPLFAYLLPYLDQRSVLVNWDYQDPINNVNRGPQSNTAVVLPLLLCPTDEIAQNPVTDTKWGWFYALTSYGGNGGTRSYYHWLYNPYPGTPTADGVFHATGPGAKEDQPCKRTIRPEEITNGVSRVLLFGERSHDDPNFKSFPPASNWDNLDQWGWWGASTTARMIGHVTMSAYAPINYQLRFAKGDPSGQQLSSDAKEKRLSAYGSGHPNGANFCFVDGHVEFLTSETEIDVLRALSTRAKPK